MTILEELWYGNITPTEYSRIENNDNYKEALRLLEETKEYINAGSANIAEASFAVDGLFCSVDILHKNPYGCDIIEVYYLHSEFIRNNKKYQVTTPRGKIDLQSDNVDDAKIEIEKNYLKKLDVYKVTFNKDGNDYVFASVVKE